MHVRAIASRVALVLAASAQEPVDAFLRFDDLRQGALNPRQLQVPSRIGSE